MHKGELANINPPRITTEPSQIVPNHPYVSHQRWGSAEISGW